MPDRTPGFLLNHRYLSASVLALVLGAGASQAAEPFPAQVLEDAQLAALRGGFSLRGLEMEFGASLRSFQDGRLLMETLVNVTDQGTRTTRTIPHAVDALAAGPGAAAPAGTADPSGIDLGGLGDAGRVTVSDARGITAAVHQVTRQRILSVLVSRATDTALRQGPGGYHRQELQPVPADGARGPDQQPPRPQRGRPAVI
ncbi:hypothetical protein [Thiohalobacter thiocyanaticus]|nr:hypothetical protein [Thiohalobacter thiocyanaticus]